MFRMKYIVLNNVAKMGSCVEQLRQKAYSFGIQAKVQFILIKLELKHIAETFKLFFFLIIQGATV